MQLFICLIAFYFYTLTNIFLNKQSIKAIKPNTNINLFCLFDRVIMLKYF